MEKYITNFVQCKVNDGRNIFENGVEVGWPMKTPCFELVKEGIISFKFLVEESKWEGICIKWWDRQFCNNIRLVYHSKYLEYYLLKNN